MPKFLPRQHPLTSPASDEEPRRARRGFFVSRSRAQLFILLALVSTLGGHFAHQNQWRGATFLDRAMADRAFQMRGAKTPEEVAEKLPQSRDIVIVELPHEIPRDLLARLLDKLKMARVVGLDLMLADFGSQLAPAEREWFRRHSKEWAQDDQTLGKAIKNAGNVVVGLWPDRVSEEDPQNPGTVVSRLAWARPAPLIAKAARQTAHLTVISENEDGLVRRVQPFLDTPLPTPAFGLAIAGAALRISPTQIAQLPIDKNQLVIGERRFPLERDGALPIDYLGPRECFDYESNRVIYSRVLEIYEPEDFAGKIVLVGQTDYRSKDIFPTAMGDLPGLHIHANIVATLLDQGAPLHPLAPVWTFLIALGAAILLGLPLLRLPPWTCFFWALAESLGIIMITGAIFAKYRALLPASVPLLAVFFMFNALAIFEYARARWTLGRVVGEKMVPSLLDTSAKPELGGRLEEATAFFCDLRGYSALSEKMAPHETMELLNSYTDALVNVVEGFGGRPIDFYGDGVFVLFDEENHALQAVRAALAVQQILKIRFQKGHLTSQLEAGIALDCGPMVVGFVGGENHLKPGAVGDAINVAARLQGFSTECGYNVLITRAVLDRLKGEIEAKRCGEYAIRGREVEVEVFGVGEQCQIAKKISSGPQQLHGALNGTVKGNVKNGEMVL